MPEGKLLINTINAFSYNNARRDILFEEALINGDFLIPDGISIVRACRFLNAKSQPKERIAGWDLFEFEMQRLNEKGGKVMFLGSSEKVLSLIREKSAVVYPNLDVVTFSPPYRSHFTVEDDLTMINAINDANPDLLWIGMTAPKQEKWTYANWDRLNIHCHVGTVGAVFDFFAGTYKRAPKIWQRAGFEWLYRLLREPRRMWRRYIIGNVIFLSLIVREKIGI
jgi:N-acetylglucosaminyldiphosphoundecaprenol N-acetyl-beta-D-mannosaminyltransferase